MLGLLRPLHCLKSSETVVLWRALVLCPAYCCSLNKSIGCHNDCKWKTITHIWSENWVEWETVIACRSSTASCIVPPEILCPPCAVSSQAPMSVIFEDLEGRDLFREVGLMRCPPRSTILILARSLTSMYGLDSTGVATRSKDLKGSK